MKLFNLKREEKKGQKEGKSFLRGFPLPEKRANIVIEVERDIWQLLDLRRK